MASWHPSSQPEPSNSGRELKKTFAIIIIFRWKYHEIFENIMDILERTLLDTALSNCYSEDEVNNAVRGC